MINIIIYLLNMSFFFQLAKLNYQRVYQPTLTPTRTTAGQPTHRSPGIGFPPLTKWQLWTKQKRPFLVRRTYDIYQFQMMFRVISIIYIYIHIYVIWFVHGFDHGYHCWTWYDKPKIALHLKNHHSKRSFIILPSSVAPSVWSAQDRWSASPSPDS